MFKFVIFFSLIQSSISTNSLWEKDTTHTGKRPECPFVKIRIDGANYAWNTLNICKKRC